MELFVSPFFTKCFYPFFYSKKHEPSLPQLRKKSLTHWHRNLRKKYIKWALQLSFHKALRFHGESGKKLSIFPSTTDLISMRLKILYIVNSISSNTICGWSSTNRQIWYYTENIERYLMIFSFLTQKIQFLLLICEGI